MEVEDLKTQDYRSFLREILLRKQKGNALYTLRSFAKKMGVQPSFLTMLFKGQRGLSEEKCYQIAENLNLSSDETKKLQLLLRLDKSKLAGQRDDVLKELEELEPALIGQRDLTLEHFKTISNWYHMVIPLLVELPGFKWSFTNAARALGISKQELIDALDRLVALEMISKKGHENYVREESRFFVSSSLHSEALRKYHTQMLEKTIIALSAQKPDQRYTATLNLALDEEQTAEVKTILDAAYEKIRSIADRPAKKKGLFHLNLNLFSLLKEGPKE